MLAQAAALLKLPAAQDKLAGRIDLLMVDEFQDTSPVQLEVVMALAGLARRTVWVGDRKQGIFGFQGSDPALMLAATEAVLGGAEPHVLPRSYRSRPPWCSSAARCSVTRWLLTASEAEVRIDAACPEPGALEGSPALHLWSTKNPSSRKGVSEGAGLAKHLRRVSAGTLQVREPVDDRTQPAPTRSATFGDVAILARTNKQCGPSLRPCGPRALRHSWPRKASEGARPRSCEPDSPSLPIPRTPWQQPSSCGCWATCRTPGRGSQTASRSSKPMRRTEPRPPSRTIPDCSGCGQPWTEAATGLPARRWWRSSPPSTCTGWCWAGRIPSPTSQTSRSFARSRQTTSRRVSPAGSRHGLGPRAAPRHASRHHGTGASHRAGRRAGVDLPQGQGLEWPVVLCCAPDRLRREDPPASHGGAETFDLSHPLQGRSVRWWPWPYASRKGPELSGRPRPGCGPGARGRAAGRHRRLLYVAFTRASDHLVPSRIDHKTGGTAWLDVLEDGEGNRTRPALGPSGRRRSPCATRPSAVPWRPPRRSPTRWRRKPRCVLTGLQRWQRPPRGSPSE